MYETYMKDDENQPRRSAGRPTSAVADPEGVSIRLRIARLEAGYVTLTAAEDFIEDRGIVSARAYKSYETGTRAVQIKHIKQFEEAFGIRPTGWLEHGGGETLESLELRVAELEQEAQQKLRDVTSAPLPAKTGKTASSSAVNQLTSEPGKVDINASHLVPVGRIPFLLAEEIASFLAGKRDWAMAGSTLPVPEEFAGPDFFSCEIGATDTSMVGEKGDSFPPRTLLIINSNRAAWADETPPFYVYARPKGMKGWLLRRLDAALPLSVASEFTLSALNPSIEAIRVSDPSKWEIAGKMAFAGRRY